MSNEMVQSKTFEERMKQMSENKTLRERIEQWKRPATCKCASCFTQLFYNSGKESK